jgi:hypothetical protein
MAPSIDVAHAIQEIDRMIDEVSDAGESQCELLREQLESARASRLGEMTEEYRLCLRLALEAVGCITDPDRRQRVELGLRRLIGEPGRS